MEDENKIETMEPQEDQEGHENGFLEGWDEEGRETPAEHEEPENGGPEKPAVPDEPEGGEPENEKPEDPAAGESGQDGQGGQEPQQAQPVPRDVVLDRDGVPLTIPAAEIPGLLHRGLDYEALKNEYDEARPVLDLMRSFAEQAGLSLADYAARLRVQAKQAQGMEETEARRAVEMEDREARLAAREAAERTWQENARRAQETARQTQARIQNDVKEFAGVFPKAARNYQSIPQEVWDAVNGGMSLVAAYARYSAAQAARDSQAAAEEAQRAEVVRQQNEKNAARSTGSMQSAGGGHGPKDPFAEGFDED